MNPLYTLLALFLLFISLFVSGVLVNILGYAAICVLLSGISQQLSRYAKEYRETLKAEE